MIKEVTAVGKDVAEAKENARAALGAGPLDDVTFEILELGSRGIFGIIGVKPAKVKASIEVPDKVEPRRNDRPRRDPQPQNAQMPAQKSAQKPAQDAVPAKSENQNRSERKPKPQNNNNKPKNPAPKPKREDFKFEPAEKPEKPRSVVIPEAELKLTPRTVEDGQDMSYEFVKKLIADLGLNASIELYSCEDGTRRITIVGEEASALIGHHGDTLDALQYLANLASAQKNAFGERDKSRVTVDIEGYRAKREETLRALARRMAAKALRNNRSVMLEPMSAYERRIIHSEIQGIEGVSTNSIGSDNNRKIVIYLTDKKPAGLFEEENDEAVSDEAIAEAETADISEAVTEEAEAAEVSEEAEVSAEGNDSEENA